MSEPTLPTSNENSLTLCKHYRSQECPQCEIERLRALLRDSRISIDKAADADCVCVDGPQRCKYCRPHRALRDRIDAALSGDCSTFETRAPLTLGKLILQTARGEVKERILTPAEVSDINAQLGPMWEKAKGRFRFVPDETLEQSKPSVEETTENRGSLPPVGEPSGANRPAYQIGDPCPTCASGRIGQSGHNYRCANCGWLGPRIPEHTKGG